jgi:hypothetical protein
MCSFGVAPSSAVFLPTNQTLASKMPAGTITDSIPFLNVLPFSMCQSMANPSVAAATAAKLGVFTPMPCTPVPAGVWIVGSPTVMIAKKPALNSTSQLICSFGGVINITFAGQVTVQIP